MSDVTSRSGGLAGVHRRVRSRAADRLGSGHGRTDGSRVAVYIDFDNVVISRYDHVFGDGAWRKRQRPPTRHPGPTTRSTLKLAEPRRRHRRDPRLRLVVRHRRAHPAYADWSVPANAAYQEQLVDRAVDLTQLFATSAGRKNGADIRLSVDAVDDLFQHADLTHVVIVAGDSDYIALAQRCKRLGRFVVGIGVTGSTSPALVAACDEFSDYDDLPGVKGAGAQPAREEAPARGCEAKTARPRRPSRPRKPEPETESARRRTPPRCSVRAIRIALEKSDDEWLYSGGVKSHAADGPRSRRSRSATRRSGLRRVARQGRRHPDRRQRAAPGAAAVGLACGRRFPRYRGILRAQAARARLPDAFSRLHGHACPWTCGPGGMARDRSSAAQ